MTARLGKAETTEEVNVSAGQSQTVTLQLPVDRSASSQGTVSAVQLRVPENVRNAISKAEQRLLKHDTQGAMKYIAEALRAFPQSSDAYRLRGLVSLSEGRPADAVGDLDRAVKLDANNVTARIILGAAFNAMAKFKEAVASITAVLPMAPKSWQAQYELGKAYAGTGDLRAALAAIDRAIAINPKFAMMRYVRAQILLEARQYGEAARDLQQFLHDAPDGPEAARVRQLLATMQPAAK